MTRLLVVPVHQLNRVYQDLQNNTTGKRYVLDIANTLNKTTKDKCVLPPPEFEPFDPSGALSIKNVIGELAWLLCCCKVC